MESVIFLIVDCYYLLLFVTCFHMFSFCFCFLFLDLCISIIELMNCLFSQKSCSLGGSTAFRFEATKGGVTILAATHWSPPRIHCSEVCAPWAVALRFDLV